MKTLRMILDLWSRRNLFLFSFGFPSTFGALVFFKILITPHIYLSVRMKKLNEFRIILEVELSVSLTKFLNTLGLIFCRLVFNTFVEMRKATSPRFMMKLLWTNIFPDWFFQTWISFNIHGNHFLKIFKPIVYEDSCWEVIILSNITVSHFLFLKLLT